MTKDKLSQRDTQRAKELTALEKKIAGVLAQKPNIVGKGQQHYLQVMEDVREEISDYLIEKDRQELSDLLIHVMITNILNRFVNHLNQKIKGGKK